MSLKQSLTVVWTPSQQICPPFERMLQMHVQLQSFAVIIRTAADQVDWSLRKCCVWLIQSGRKEEGRIQGPPTRDSGVGDVEPPVVEAAVSVEVDIGIGTDGGDRGWRACAAVTPQ